jgi:hypothetical protein
LACFLRHDHAQLVDRTVHTEFQRVDLVQQIGEFVLDLTYRC